MNEREFLHDLVNPLAIGLGNAKLLLKKMTNTPEAVTPDMMSRTVATIFESLQRMSEMVEKRRQEIKTEEAK